MKKSSIFVAFLIVLTVLFAVSCPNNKTTVSVKDDVNETATVNEAKSITFVLQTSGEFTEKIKDTSSIIVNASVFDNGETKAEASVSSISLSDNEATVTVSLTAAKAVENGELTFEIKEVKEETEEILKGVKSKISIGGKKVKVTSINAKAKVDGSTTSSFTVAQGKTADVNIVLVGATFTPKTSGSSEADATKFSLVDSSALGVSISKVTIDASNKHKATATISATSDAAMIETAVPKVFSIDESALVADDGYSKENLSFNVSVKVNYSVKLECTPLVASFEQGHTIDSVEKDNYKIKIKISNAELVGSYRQKLSDNIYEQLGKPSDLYWTSSPANTLEITFSGVQDDITPGEKEITVTLPPNVYDYEGFSNTTPETESITLTVAKITVTAKQ